jgi:tetratricopeptide (TPR) repeat protein
MKAATRLILPIAWCATLAAQMDHMHGTPGNRPAEALPPPVMISGVGNAHLRISTSSFQAQQWFDQGLSLLHCFWDFEALRAFREAARLDPDCPMCQWGIFRALSFGGAADDDLKPVVARIKELAPKASDHERGYLRSVIESFGKKGAEQSQAYQNELESVVYRYPDDLDAQLFLALSLESGFDGNGNPRTGQLYAMRILRNILRHHPENAAANHYWIHAVESSPHPESALESAGKLSRLAPGSGHMIHMPGHIFYRTGDYERARRAFLDSMRVDEAYLRAQHRDFADDRNYAHNLSYMIANSAEQGREREALEYAARLDPLAEAAADRTHPGSAIFYIVQIGGTRTRLAIRFGSWQDAIDHPIDFGNAFADGELPPAARALRDGMVIYATAMQSLDRGATEEAAQASGRLDDQFNRLMTDQDQDDHTVQLVAKILAVASKELAGNVASHRGDYQRAKELLNQAIEAEKALGYSEPPLYSRPSLESLGYAAIRAGDWQGARAAFQQVLQVRPNSGFGYYGIALSYDKEGARPAAAKAYQEFLNSWQHADPDLPMIRSARQALGRSN